MPTFREAADSYLQNGGCSEYLDRVVLFMGDMDVRSISPWTVYNMALELYPKGAGSTRNRQAVTPSSVVLNHASFRGWCLPFKAKRFKEVKDKEKHPASAAWMFQFLKQADKEGHYRIAALVLFMHQTASRVSEALRLEWSDVAIGERTALLRRTKTEENSIRYLTEDLINRFLNLPRDNKLAFGYTCRWNINERLKAICKRADIEYRSTHEAGRHSFATNAMNLGVGIRIAMDAGGWKSSSLFIETYSHTVKAGRMVANRLDEEKDKSGFKFS